MPYYNSQAPYSLNFSYNIHVLGHPSHPIPPSHPMPPAHPYSYDLRTPSMMPPPYSYPKQGMMPGIKPNYIIL